MVLPLRSQYYILNDVYDPVNQALRVSSAGGSFSTGELQAPDVTSSGDFTINTGDDGTVVYNPPPFEHRILTQAGGANNLEPSQTVQPGQTNLKSPLFPSLQNKEMFFVYEARHSDMIGQDLYLPLVICGADNNAGLIEFDYFFGFQDLGGNYNTGMTPEGSGTVSLENPGLSAAGTLQWRDVDIVLPGSSDLTGTVSSVSGSKVITGIGTLFNSELVINQQIMINNRVGVIDSIDSDTQLTLVDDYGYTFNDEEIRLVLFNIGTNLNLTIKRKIDDEYAGDVYLQTANVHKLIDTPGSESKIYKLVG